MSSDQPERVVAPRQVAEKAPEIGKKEESKSFNRLKSDLFSERKTLAQNSGFIEGNSHFNLFGANQEQSFPARPKLPTVRVAEPARVSSNGSIGSAKVGVGLIRKKEGHERKASTRGIQVRGGNPITGEGYDNPVPTNRGRVRSCNIFEIYVLGFSYRFFDFRS